MLLLFVLSSGLSGFFCGSVIAGLVGAKKGKEREEWQNYISALAAVLSCFPGLYFAGKGQTASLWWGIALAPLVVPMLFVVGCGLYVFAHRVLHRLSALGDKLSDFVVRVREALKKSNRDSTVDDQ